MTSKQSKRWQHKKRWTNAKTAAALGVSVVLVEKMRGGQRTVTARTLRVMELIDGK